MWIISVAFVVVLGLAHVFHSGGSVRGLRMSEMRAVTPLAHGLFLLLIGASGCYAWGAYELKRRGSALVGLLLAICIAVAWLTPTVSPIHDFFATAPFVILFLYVPVVLASAGAYFSAALTLAIPPICDGICMLFVGPSGELQKLNSLLFLAILNYFYYRVLPEHDPL